MAVATTHIVRIKPANKRVEHIMCLGGSAYTFKKERGWYKVTSEVASACEDERMNDMDPNSAYVFDVTTPDEVQKVIRGESRVTVGTAESPNELAAATTVAIGAGERNAPAEEKGQSRIGRKRDS